MHRTEPKICVQYDAFDYVQVYSLLICDIYAARADGLPTDEIDHAIRATRSALEAVWQSLAPDDRDYMYAMTAGWDELDRLSEQIVEPVEVWKHENT